MTRAPAWTWIAGMVAFAAVISITLGLSELEEIARLLRRMRPEWLLAACGLQAATYVCAAAVWKVALTRAGHRCSLRSLVPVSLAMLFTNQAVPSAGLSGSTVVLRALAVRSVPAPAAMAALLVGLVTQYGAYLIAIAASVIVLGASHRLSPPLLGVVALFAIGSVAVPGFILWSIRSTSSSPVRHALRRVRALRPLLDALATASPHVLRDPRVLGAAIGWQFVETILDAATLYVVLFAVGITAPVALVFASFVMAFVAARALPTPLGLGTFEGASIAMLHLSGVGIEAALAGTLLFRGFAVWLPMLPGFWCMRLVTAQRGAKKFAVLSDARNAQ